MMHGRNNGKKLMAVRIVAHAFEIVSVAVARCAPGRRPAS
jgi:ribosomal protein S7